MSVTPDGFEVDCFNATGVGVLSVSLSNCLEGVALNFKGCAEDAI